MQLEEKAEEILESLWIHNENKGSFALPESELQPEYADGLGQLLEAAYVTLADGVIKITDTGKPLARNVVRRHRLAERLLADVMGSADYLMHEKACKFEHLLDRGLDENICSLLGHPKICPHGKPIPPGRCCRKGSRHGRQVVSALSQLSPGQHGKVAYIYAPESDQMQKLTAMGLLPGAPITLTQDFPSYVFTIKRSQFAVDAEIAGSIYVRIMEDDAPADLSEEPASSAAGKSRWFSRRFGRR